MRCTRTVMPGIIRSDPPLPEEARDTKCLARPCDVADWTMPRLTASRKPFYDAEEAIAALSAADPKLGRLIAKAGPLLLRISGSLSPFESLTESIIYQQLHGKAAAAIHARM